MFLGGTIAFWVQTGILFSSALIAIYVIYHNGKMARRRATIDLIINEQKDTQYNEFYNRVRKMIENQQRLVDLAHELDNTHLQDGEDFTAVRFVLNRLEFIAQGIRQGAFEEQIYKDLKYTNIMSLWREVRPLVEEIRRKRKVPTYYQELEWLTSRWKDAPIEKL